MADRFGKNTPNDRIVVKIIDVDVVNRSAACQDKTGGKFSCSFRQIGAAFRIPSPGDLWVANRNGYIWYLDSRLDRADEAAALSNLQPGDTRVLSDGTIYFEAEGISFNEQPVGAMTYDAFTGDATTTDFRLASPPISHDSVQVYVNGAFKPPTVYTLTGQELSFHVAPANSDVVIVYYQRV